MKEAAIVDATKKAEEDAAIADSKAKKLAAVVKERAKWNDGCY